MTFFTTRLIQWFRWLLQMDVPVLPRSNSEIAAEVERNYRWNFVVNLLDGGFFWLSISFASSATILPLFISKITPSPLAIGLLAVIAQSAWFLPQLLTANPMERLARKKPVVVNLGFFTERVPMWFMVLAALIAIPAPTLSLVILLGSYAWHSLGAGVVAISWQDLIARCFPVDRRGRFFGTTMFVGSATAAVGALFSAWLLQTYPFSLNFVLAFSIAAVGVTISWFFLALTREPVQPVNVPKRSTREYLDSLLPLLHEDHNFRRFMLSRLLMALGAMGAGFLTVSAVQRWQIPDSTAGLFTVAILVGQTAGNLGFGFMADRRGHKLSLEIGCLAYGAAFVVALLAPSPTWYFAAFALIGVGSSATIVSGILVVMEFSAPERRPTYIGLANTGVGVVSAVAPLLGALLASIGYGWLFALSALASFVAFPLMRWWVREPRWEQQLNPQNP